jgi:hypothetical protein
MKKITSAQELHEAIEALEQKKADQMIVLEHHFADFYESLRPANLIKNTFQNVFSSNDSRRNILGSVIGLGTGFLSKKLLVGKSVSVFKKILGAAVEFGVAGLIAKNAGRIKEKGSEIINKVFKKKNHDFVDWKKDFEEVE